MKILVTGTPGVGKTTISKKLSEMCGIEHIDITDYIKSNKVYESYDERLSSLVFDEDHVIDHLNKYIEDKDSFIIDTHSPVVAIDITFDYIFHVKCDTSVLGDRLEARGYSQYKIEKNLESEIFNVIGEEIEEYFDARVFDVNGSNTPIDGVSLCFEDVLKTVSENAK